MPACLPEMIRNAANSLLQMNSDPDEPLSFVGPQWANSWLYRHFLEIATFLVVDGGTTTIDTEVIVQWGSHFMGIRDYALL